MCSRKALEVEVEVSMLIATAYVSLQHHDPSPILLSHYPGVSSFLYVTRHQWVVKGEKNGDYVHMSADCLLLRISCVNIMRSWACQSCHAVTLLVFQKLIVVSFHGTPQ